MAKRKGGAADEQAAAAAQEVQDPPQQAPRQKTARREEQAAIARRRAAHFANFGDDGADEEENVHAGGSDARTLGPWSSAVELVNARQAATEERNSKLQQLARHQEQDVAWQPARDPTLGPRPCGAVPSLFSLALAPLVAHIDAVVSLWGVPDSIRSQIAAAVAARRGLGPRVALLFGRDAPSELCVPDCHQLDAGAMRALLALLLLGQEPDMCDGKSDRAGDQAGASSGDGSDQAPDTQGGDAAAAANAAAGTAADAGAAAAAAAGPAGAAARLERLELGSCGRGFDDAAAALVAGAGPLGALRVLALGGAYRLTDGGLGALLAAAPGLAELAVPSAPRLTGSFLARLPALVPGLTRLDVSHCGALGGGELTALLAQMVSLQQLVLDGIDEVDAQVLAAAGRAPRLRSLSVAFCRGVGDAALQALASARGRAGSGGSSKAGLQELVLDDCAGVGDAGLLALLGGPDGCRRLRRLSLAHCTRLTDASLVPLAERGVLQTLSLNSLPGVGPGTLGALGGACADTLQELDVSFCRGVTESALGALADKCGRLAVLSVYSCTQLTPRFLHGHGRDGLELRGVPTSCLG